MPEVPSPEDTIIFPSCGSPRKRIAIINPPKHNPPSRLKRKRKDVLSTIFKRRLESKIETNSIYGIIERGQRTAKDQEQSLSCAIKKEGIAGREGAGIAGCYRDRWL